MPAAPMITRTEVNEWLERRGHKDPDSMTEWDRFDAAMTAFLAVPHSTIQRRVEAETQKSAANPNRRGPKSKNIAPLLAAIDKTPDQSRVLSAEESKRIFGVSPRPQAAQGSEK